MKAQALPLASFMPSSIIGWRGIVSGNSYIIEWIPMSPTSRENMLHLLHSEMKFKWDVSHPFNMGLRVKDSQAGCFITSILMQLVCWASIWFTRIDFLYWQTYNWD
jgi:hypothetical protein